MNVAIVTRFATFIALFLIVMISAEAQVTLYPNGIQTSFIEGYGSRSFQAAQYGQASTPVVDFGLFQRPFDLLQNQTPVLVSTSTNGTAYTSVPVSTAFPALSGRMDSSWNFLNYVQLVFNIPMNSAGGQIIVGQITGATGAASFVLTVDYSTSEVFDLKPTSVNLRNPVKSRSCRAYRIC